MAALPSWSWLLVGLIIAATSWTMEMPLFFWLGWLFVIVGIAKFVIGFLTRERETPQERRVMQQLAPAHHQYYRCPCGNPVRVADHFCNHCGRRLR